MALQAQHKNIGIHPSSFSRVLGRMVKAGAGLRPSSTRFLEVVVSVLLTVWALELLWMGNKFFRLTTLLEFPF